ncbi:coiled-coil-helix-coiled-coil-helix domain containing 5 [Rhinolophus ferrumequinum]|uniref:Coiled-coil-helix-coiled-coil-helix domain containing 5 n=2 Tax=Rhinolophus ferrumequinum TaxID=59479 RepID=A0A7J7R2N6_RHIFE|nr:coiled-coil-helix-coiled-coil-helix domain containing 5 [Rhinolophus ferrumequinum]
MSIAQCTSSQSARPAPSPSRPSRSVCGRTRRPRASVQSRHSHCLPPEDTLDRRKMTGVTATWCPQPWRVARCPEGSGLGTHNK